MNLKKNLLGALGFAHLAGIGVVAAKSKDDKDEPTDDVVVKEDGDESGDTEQDREDGDSKKSKKGKAKDGDDKEEANDDDKEYDDEDPNEPKNKKGKKADDDDSDEEMRGSGAAACARRRERARCAAIFADAAAGRNPVLAANLAFNTSMSRTEALTVLRSTPAAAPQRTRNNPNLGSDARPRDGGQSSADRMAARMKKAAGNT